MDMKDMAVNNADNTDKTDIKAEYQIDNQIDNRADNMVKNTADNGVDYGLDPGGIWRETGADKKEEAPLVRRMRENYGFFGGFCLLYGVLFSFCLYKNPNGITWPVLILGMIGISYGMLKKIGFTVKKDTVVYCIGMALLGIQTSMTCSGFLVFFNLAGILLLFLTAMMHQFYADEKWSFPAAVKNLTIICFASIGHIFWPFVHGFAYFTEAREEAGEGRKRTAAVGLGILIAAGILVVVFPMLLRSDRVFEEIFKEAFYDVEFGSFFGVFFMVLIGFVSSYGFFGALCSKQLKETEGKRKDYNPLIAITFTGILALVYTLYAGIQVLFLFLKLGGLPDGVTYSEYAREGFFELLFVGIVNFILVLVCMALFRGNKLLKGILTVICCCTFIMIASAVYRMLLYVQTYHLTFLRILALWFLVLLAFVMAGVAVSIYRKSFPLFRYIVAAVGCGYILFSFARPDRVIAEYNLKHMEQVSMHDVQYLLYCLSDDAAPVVAELDLERIVDFSRNPDRKDAGGVYAGGIEYTDEQELINYFYSIADRYKSLSFREMNLSKLQARSAAEKWIAENDGH